MKTHMIHWSLLLVSALAGCDDGDNEAPTDPGESVELADAEWACIRAYCNRAGTCEETCRDGRTDAWIQEHCTAGERPMPSTGGKQPSGGSYDYDQFHKRGERGTCDALGYQACGDAWVNQTYIDQFPWKRDQACSDDPIEIGRCPAGSGLECNYASGVLSQVCTRPIPDGAVASDDDLPSGVCTTTHSCGYGEVCERRRCLLRCDVPVGRDPACSECLASCRGLPSCCTGSGCICDSAC